MHILYVVIHIAINVIIHKHIILLITFYLIFQDLQKHESQLKIPQNVSMVLEKVNNALRLVYNLKSL